MMLRERVLCAIRRDGPATAAEIIDAVYGDASTPLERNRIAAVIRRLVLRGNITRALPDGADAGDRRASGTNYRYAYARPQPDGPELCATCPPHRGGRHFASTCGASQ
jgi:predicted transcriptional regulator